MLLFHKQEHVYQPAELILLVCSAGQYIDSTIDDQELST